MSKAARLRRKRAKARTARSQAQRRRRQGRKSTVVWMLERFWYGVVLTWKGVVGILLLLAAGAQIYFSTWRMSVTPGETPRAGDPFTTMFVLHNEGQFAMHDIKFQCLVNDVVYPNRIREIESLTESDWFNARRLEANSQTSAPCEVLLRPGSAPLSVDLTVIVSYRPSLFPFQREARFRFIATPNDRGSFSWTPMAAK